MKNVRLPFALLALACVVACSQSAPVPEPPHFNADAFASYDADAADAARGLLGDSPEAHQARLEHLAERNPHVARVLARAKLSATRPPLAADSRSPAEIAQAACRGADGQWRCKGTLPKATLAAAQAPTVPTSWTVPAWAADFQNLTTCASDNNTCTSTTCGAAGSGIGPCKSVQEIVIHRWGCVGMPMACPNFQQQSTTLTILSNQPSDGSDALYLNWTATNVSEPFFTVITPLGAAQQVDSGVFGVITTKNRATKQRWQATFVGTPAAGWLVNDTTQSSWFWVEFNVGGGTHVGSLSQPMTQWSTSNFFPAEKEPITAGDAYVAYLPVQINIGFLGVVSATNTPFWVVENAHIISPGGIGSSVVPFGGEGAIVQTQVDAALLANQGTAGFVVDDINNFFPVGGFEEYSAGTNILGGVHQFVELSGTGGLVDNDAIIETRLIGTSSAEIDKGTEYLGNIERNLGITDQFNVSFSGTNIVWGNGCINNRGQYFYRTTAANVFLQDCTCSGCAGVHPLELDAQQQACSMTIAQPAVVNCGIALDNSHLDAAAGAAGFGGRALFPGIAATFNAFTPF